MKRIKKVLVANRGEIAQRIIRTIREMGIRSVAVYSDVDEKSGFVLSSDEYYPLGGIESIETYLNIEKIINIAKKTHCDAIHPGYGFLAENSLFAQCCKDEGLIFIGPKPSQIKLMGEKTLARKKMIEAGVPVVPGSEKPVCQRETLLKEAEKIGFPLLLKASLGGGGKGMKIVRNKDELFSSFDSAQREAHSAFGDPSVYIEKYLDNPRHIEVQILGDKYGNVIHLFERECSVQRRHQKIIEETPAMDLSSKTREEICRVALKAAKAISYECAGTIEFLVDGDKNFYFLEMNTRLQVEHPISELTLCLDLVRAQVLVAEGNLNPFLGMNLTQRGHAIECRIYAEDPFNNFLPSPGKITHYKIPSGPGVRVDDGVYKGSVIPKEYDPIISKLIVWGEDRQIAIERMKRALKEYLITGIKHNIPLLQFVLETEDFRRGKYNTGILKKYSFEENFKIDDSDIECSIISAIFNKKERRDKIHSEGILGSKPSLWRQVFLPENKYGLRNK